MSFVTAAAIASLGGAAYKIGTGIYDRRQAKKRADELNAIGDPVYGTPESQVKALNNAQVAAQSYNLAGQTNLEQGQDDILANATQGINNTATDSGSALQAMLGAYGNRSRSQNEIGFRAAQQKLGADAEVRRQLGITAGYEDKAFDINVMQPFTRKWSNVYGLNANGNQLISSGIGDIQGTVAGMASNKSLENYINKMYSSNTNNGNQTTTTNNGGFVMPTFNDADVYDYNGGDVNAG
jgi:hypothetical protein